MKIAPSPRPVPTLLLSLSWLLVALTVTSHAQTHETVTFHHQATLTSGKIFVSGNLPELGNSDLAHSVQMEEIADGIWEIDVELPVNRDYQYQFFHRFINTAQVPNSSHGTPKSDVISASTSTVPPNPVTKSIHYRGALTQPMVHWRQDQSPYQATALAAGADGFQMAEVGESYREIDFYFTNGDGTVRDPAPLGGAPEDDPVYSVRADNVYVQDGQVFVYQPAPSVSPPRRDYDPQVPPTFASRILDQDRPYRVFLPRGYDDHPERHYPLVLFADGHALFEDAPGAQAMPQDALDPDGVNLASLIASGQMHEVIAVGIDSLHYLERYRYFIPFGDTTLNQVGIADQFADFLRLEFLPHLHERYRTLEGAANTAFAGYQLGASLALYLGWDFPNVFGKIAAQTPDQPSTLGRALAFEANRDIRLYLDSGNTGFANVRDLRNTLVAKPFSRYAVEGAFRYYFAPGQNNSAANFVSRFPQMFSFLFPAEEPLDATPSAAPIPYWLRAFNLTIADWDLDNDDDGWTTREEFRFGTSPIDPADGPEFDADIAGDVARFLWQSKGGVIYNIEHSTDLKNWEILGDPIVGTGEFFEGQLTLPDDEQARFWQLKVRSPIDSDRDGLNDVEEGILGTDIFDVDTDGDSFGDGDEVLYNNTDPLVPNYTGGSIAGKVFLDENGDGVVTGDGPAPGTHVFLDLNYDGIRQDSEPSAETGTDGGYLLEGVAPGTYHVTQELPLGWVQTLPGGLPPTPDGLADTLVSFEHSGEGAFPFPYGLNASDSLGVAAPTLGRGAEEVDPALILKPIGLRSKVPPLGVYGSTEFLTLSKDSSVLVKFEEEAIIDGPGIDFNVVTTDGQGVDEKIHVWVGASPSDLIFISTFDEGGRIGIDLGRHGIDYPIQYVKATSVNNKGSFPGFELVGFEGIHYAPRSLRFHQVTVAAGQAVNQIDFAKLGRDLPPKVYISVDDANLDAGESTGLNITATDDFGVTGMSLTANGNPVALDAGGRGTVTAAWPGELILRAEATDAAGQTGTASLDLYVHNADGSLPADPNIPSLQERTAGAPEIRIHSPGSGAVVEADTPVIATITDDALTHWQLHYAPIDDIDPYLMSASDPDYILIAEGTDVMVNEPLGTLPASTLADGIYFLRVTATSGATTAYAGHALGVRVDSAALFPTITLTAPLPNAEVTFLTDLVGSITSDQPIREWYVETALAGEVDLTNLGNPNGAQYTRIASGSGNQAAGTVLATFDPTVLPNNSYVLKVTAWNEIGLGRTDGVVVNVGGENKLGRLRTEFTDLELDLAGVPVVIQRVYDSFAADSVGDFGYGWSIGYADPELDETDRDNGQAFSVKAWRPGTRLYINSPSGKRVGFTFDMEIASTSFFGTVFRPIFRPDPGVYETIEVPEGDSGFLAQNAAGEATISLFGLPYNPDEFILTTKEGLRYTYHETEGLIDVRDQAGNTLAYSPTGIKHSSGAEVTFVRDAQGRITEITGPGGASWHYAYDASGNLVSVTDPAGNIVTLTYHAQPDHYLNAIIDPLGRTGTRYEYDADGRLAAIIDEDGNRSEETWDLTGFSGTVSDFRGNVTTVRYDQRGNVIQEELPNGGTRSYTYDDPANPDLETSVTDPNGNTTSYTYDERGNQTEIDPPVGRDWDTEYNEDNKVTLRRFPDLRTEQLSYGTNGKLTEVSYTSVLKRTFSYDASGNITSAKDVSGNTFYYDYLGSFQQLSAVETQLGGRAEMTYDDFGLPSLLKNAFGGETLYTYDEAGQLLEETDPYGEKSTATYPDGLLATLTDPHGSVTHFEYDTAGRVTREKFEGADTLYTYDPDGNQTSVTDAVGNISSMIYDAGNRPLTLTDPQGRVTTHSYDLAGNRVQSIDRLGRKRTFEYDALHRLIAERWHSPADDSVIHEILFTYNRDQKLDTVTDGGLIYRYVNLSSSEVTSLDITLPGLEKRTIRYAYENMTDVSEVTLGRKFHDYRRGENGAVTMIHLLAPDTSFSARLDIHRNAGGFPSALWRYDNGSVLATAADIVSRSLFSYDLTGLPLSITHQDASETPYAQHGTFTYTRDAGRRLATANDGVNLATYTYDSHGQISAIDHSAATDESYLYDLGGNRTSSHLHGASYVTAAGNRLTTAGDFTYTWDAEGNLLQRTHTVSGEITDLSWDHRNRLVKVERRPSAGAAPSHTVDYLYDYRDLQIGRTENGVTTWTIYGVDQMPLCEYTGADPEATAVFYYLPDILDRFVGEWRRDQGMRWFLTDHLGSVRAVTAADGAVIATIDYDAFGNITSLSETQPGDAGSLLFAGRHFDATTGFYYNRARWYDPVIGRFLSEDPLGFDGGDTNLYRYALNDPINASDPTGTTVAAEYGKVVKKIAKRAKKFGKKVGKNLQECFEGIAEALEDASNGFASSPKGTGACQKLPPIP